MEPTCHDSPEQHVAIILKGPRRVGAVLVGLQVTPLGYRHFEHSHKPARIATCTKRSAGAVGGGVGTNGARDESLARADATGCRGAGHYRDRQQP